LERIFQGTGPCSKITSPSASIEIIQNLTRAGVTVRETDEQAATSGERLTSMPTGTLASLSSRFSLTFK
jgi:hypothetical protein